jgi:hypothetical protein
LLGGFLAWCVSLAFRDRSWAFILWFPFSASSLIASFAWLGLLPQLGNSGSGAAEGFAALGVALAFLSLLPALVLLFLSIRFRPRHYPPAIVVSTILICAVGLPAVWARGVRTSETPVRLIFRATDGSLVPAVRVEYESRNKENGFSAPVLKGAVVSNIDGLAIVFTRNTHELNLRLAATGYAPTQMSIERSFPRLKMGRQCNLSWQITVPTHRWPQSKSEMFYIPDEDTITAEVYLPRIDEVDLPYPNL